MRMTLLVGPIASGKSTYARKRAKEGALIVNDDAIVMAVHGGDYSMYSDQFKPLYIAIETAIITAAALVHRDIVVDRGCRSRSCRTRFASLGRSLGYEIDARMFDWAALGELAGRRMASEPRGMTFDQWKHIAEAHEATYEPVAPSELIRTTTY